MVALTDAGGSVVDRYGYGVWGSLVSSSEAVPQRLRYAGYWYDAELGWYWASVRYYSPSIKRWLQPDPSQQDGVRTYVYAGDDPVDATDPSGLAKVVVRFEQVNNRLPVLAANYHAYIVVTDGNIWVKYEATPDKSLPVAGNVYGTLIAHRIPSKGFGNKAGLQKESSVWHPTLDALATFDKRRVVRPVASINSAVNDSHSVVWYDQRFTSVLNNVNRKRIPYDDSAGLLPGSTGYNSNAFGYTALRRVFPGVYVNPIPPVPAPGWGVTLPGV